MHITNYKPKDFAVISKKNINKTTLVKNQKNKLKREQKRLSRKYECLKTQNKTKKGEATRQNIRKQIVKLQRLCQRLVNIRNDYINNVLLISD